MAHAGKQVTSRTALFAIALIAATAGCHRSPAAGALQSAPDEGVFVAAARHVAATEGWDVYVDPRVMDSVPVAFEPESVTAPIPAFASAASTEQGRARTLERAGIHHRRMDAFVACTRYIGGIPTDSAAADPVFSTRRRECLANQARTAAASFGAPRMLDDGRWSVRVYFLTPVSRAVFDLFLVRAADAWAIDGREYLLDITM
jgi:hypothetical protein